MEIAAIQEELKALPPDEQNIIAAFLTSLRMKRDGTFDEITSRANERDEKNWVRWNDVKSELGFGDLGNPS